MKEVEVEYLYSSKIGKAGTASVNLHLAIEVTGIPVNITYTEISDIEEMDFCLSPGVDYFMIFDIRYILCPVTY